MENKKTKNKIIDCFTVGFALFSILFGAGNLIFSTYLGSTTGHNWLLSFIFFTLADAGLVLLGILAFVKNDNKTEKIYGKIGKIPSKILEISTLICLGPLIAIPRTAATSCEILLGSHMLIFSTIYFILVFAFSYKCTKVVDIVGKYLTPILLIFITCFIIIGILQNSEVPLLAVPATEAIKKGWQMGYQTLDVLCVNVVVALLLKSLLDKGYKTKKDKKTLVLASSFIALGGLIIVYAGLTFLGAVNYDLNTEGINQATLLVKIANRILRGNSLILGIIVLLACLTTAVGLTSAVADNFSKMTKKDYKIWVIIIVLISYIVSNFGLTKIINIASPILNVVYPVIILLTVLSFFNIKNTNIHKLSTVAVLIISLFRVSFDITSKPLFITKLPLFNIGFEWIIGAVIFGIIGSFIKPKENKKKQIPNTNKKENTYE